MITHQHQATDMDAQFIEGDFCPPWMEIERILSRIESARNHYEVLGIDFSATNQKISLARQQTLTLLQPSYYKINVALPALTIGRIDRAIDRATHAFKVLSNLSKRIEYDSYLTPPAGRRSLRDQPGTSEARVVIVPEIPGFTGEAESEDAFKGASFDALNADAERFADFISSEDDNRRKWERYKLSVPVYVTGHDRVAGEWHEMTHTIDVSRIGALLYLSRRVRHRSVLHLALPLPMRLRCHRHCEPSYSVYAVVRRVHPPGNGKRIVAVEFVGENAPAGYIERPWATYSTKWDGKDRRREPRRNASEVVYLEFLNEAMERVRQEAAVAENASPGGMRVFAKSVPVDFDLIKVTQPDRNFERIATVCNRYMGKDRLERLCLQFISN